MHITGDNYKINVIDSTLTNGHQLIDNQGTITASGMSSNGIGIISRNNGDTTISNIGFIQHIGTDEGNAIKVVIGANSSTVINNTSFIFNENGSGINYSSAADGGNIFIKNDAGVNVVGQNVIAIVLDSPKKIIMVKLSQVIQQ